MNTKEELTEIIGNVVVNDKGNRIRDVFHPEFVGKIVDALMVETDINVGGKGQIDSLTEIEKIIEEAFDDTPSADVVPRAKYEKLQHKYELAVAEREANVKGFAEDINVLAKETARKLCFEIEVEIRAALASNYKALRTYDDGRNNDYILELVSRIKGKIDALRGIEAFVEELKEKYIPN